ncbi:MAG: ComEA family DNA-binding protein [Gammaproteobacteria bacterium]|nr:ComEA family DNA-binding protein [Gammaproteobacteria bacterium]
MRKPLLLLLACCAWAGLAQADAVVNINTANQQQLESVQGIGPKKAQAIIEYRQKHGKFKSIDELDKVMGFGKKGIEQLRAQVTVEDAPGAPPVPSAIHGCYSC